MPNQHGSSQRRALHRTPVNVAGVGAQRIAGFRGDGHPARHAALAAVRRRKFQRVSALRIVLRYRSGRVPPPERRLRLHLPQQTRHLADPQLNLHAEQRGQPGAAAPSGLRQQPQELGQRLLGPQRVVLVSPAPVGRPKHDLLHRFGPRAGTFPHRRQHRPSQRMCQQTIPQPNPGIVVSPQRQPIATIICRHAERIGHVLDFCQSQHVVHVRDRQLVIHRLAGLVDALAALADHRLGWKLHPKHLPGELGQLRTSRGPGAKRRRGGHRRGVAQRPPRLGCSEGGPQPAQQHRHVGALGPVVGVELVEHHVLQRVGLVPSPKFLVLVAQQQEVQHLVVGQQDVRRVGPNRLALVDHVVGPHGRVAARLPYVKPCGQPGQPCFAGDQLGDPPRLVGGQSIHRVQDQRLDAPTCPSSRMRAQ